MPYSDRVKSLAYQSDPLCWISYSGMPVAWKRRMEVRRTASLQSAERFINAMDKIMRRPHTITPTERPTMGASDPFPAHLLFLGIDAVRQPRPKVRNAPLKIAMLLHFHGPAEPFAPEKTRTSQAYTQFVKELLRDGLIERPTKEQRIANPGWAYRTTRKGDALVHAICGVPNPVERTRWVIPQ